MATNLERIRNIFVLIFIVIILGIIAFYGNPAEQSSFVCREADGTVHTEESLFGCGWFFDWNYCTNGSYVENTCTELED